MKSAIVLDGSQKSALAVVRSLGRHGISVSVGAERSSGMALHSRYATQRFEYPSPYTDENGFIAEVKKIAIECGNRPVIFAMSDATVTVLFRHQEELREYATLVFPSEEAFEMAFDKAATYSLARVSNVPTITTFSPEFSEEVVYLGDTLEYPVVLKPRRSVTRYEGKGVFKTALFVHSKESLIANFTHLKQVLGEAPLIQTLVVGEEYGVEMLAHEGKVFATVVHHRIRSHSPTGGASVLKETLEDGDLRSVLEEYANELVKKLMWSGPIMVEFKVDSDSRTPYLMEINGRFWGSLPLSVASGVDMPYLYYQYAVRGEVPEEPVHARGGVVTRHFMGDVRHLIRSLFSRDKMRAVLYPSRLMAFRSFFSLPRGTMSDVWSCKDPKPALMEVVDILKKYVCKK